MTGDRELTELVELREQVQDLRRALAYARDVAEEERRRADRAEASARTAWAVAARP